MAKAKGAKGNRSSRETPASLQKKIEKLDAEIVKLCNQRADFTVKLAEVQPEAVAPEISDEDHLASLVARNPGPLPELAVRSIMRELISGSRSLIHRTRVAYLGPAYSFSHLAAIEYFGQSVELVPVGAIGAVFEEVYRGHSRFGIVPLENSTDGRVADTLEMFTRLPVRICGEVQLRIHHHLLGKCDRSEVIEVYSRPQALSQCRNWLARHLPTARTVPVTSTSTAAQLAQDKPGAAAIASMQAGKHYGLDVLAENIEDNAANVTRFAVIGDRSAPRTGKDKTAIMFEVDHKVGALADATAVLKRARLNMTWIESFPAPNRQGAYLFFCEVEGHENDAAVKRALEGLKKKCLMLEVLGSYERAAAIG